jgi:hypothetical protein
VVVRETDDQLEPAVGRHRLLDAGLLELELPEAMDMRGSAAAARIPRSAGSSVDPRRRALRAARTGAGRRAHTLVAEHERHRGGITPVAAQPSTRWRRLIVCGSISFFDWPISISTTMIGTEITHVDHRAPDQRAHRVDLEDAHRRADAVAAMMMK